VDLAATGPETAVVPPLPGVPTLAQGEDVLSKSARKSQEKHVVAGLDERGAVSGGEVVGVLSNPPDGPLPHLLRRRAVQREQEHFSKCDAKAGAALPVSARTRRAEVLCEKPVVVTGRIRISGQQSPLREAASYREAATDVSHLNAAKGALVRASTARERLAGQGAKCAPQQRELSPPQPHRAQPLLRQPQVYAAVGPAPRSSFLVEDLGAPKLHTRSKSTDNRDLEVRQNSRVQLRPRDPVARAAQEAGIASHFRAARAITHRGDHSHSLRGSHSALLPQGSSGALLAGPSPTMATRPLGSQPRVSVAAVPSSARRLGPAPTLCTSPSPGKRQLCSGKLLPPPTPAWEEAARSTSMDSHQKFLRDLEEAEKQWTNFRSSFNEAMKLGAKSVAMHGVPVGVP